MAYIFIKATTAALQKLKCVFVCVYLFGDVAVLVDVVQVEGPVELLRDGSPQEDREAHDEILTFETRFTVWITVSKCFRKYVFFFKHIFFKTGKERMSKDFIC